MTTILPIIGTNAAYPMQGSAVSPAKQAFLTQDSVSFSSNKKDKKESHAGWWVLGGLAVVAALGIIFRKNIANAWKEGNYEAVIEDIAKRAEKKDTAKLNECIGYLSEKLRIKKGKLEAFIIRVDEKLRKQLGITSNELLILGHRKENKKLEFLNCIKANKLDDALLKAFGKSKIVDLDVTVK
jgi:hypothetical protein